ncbi:hypothetical protein LEP1GSC060_0338 [Leptospira weilii serovar Ranarum str. ICFT]|uniref:Uncharacterized protein n=1 Tax=Leptospira weilii serovar Ranarum str. ICFT TaxID=1218598 RepID=N1W8V5_9LEPT|nr:hypothetical protein LEP1GSC060_0338 [Leptospira weilii serovar Ranarum str. ICFT]
MKESIERFFFYHLYNERFCKKIPKNLLNPKASKRMDKRIISRPRSDSH